MGSKEHRGEERIRWISGEETLDGVGRRRAREREPGQMKFRRGKLSESDAAEIGPTINAGVRGWISLKTC